MRSLFFIFLFCISLFADYIYTFNTSYTDNGESLWNKKILKINISDYNDGVKLGVNRYSGTFTGDGTIYIKVGGYESYSANWDSKNVSTGDSGQTFYFNKTFLDNKSSWNNNQKILYARFENPNGGWAWAGSVTITRKLQSNPINGECGNANNFTFSYSDSSYSSYRNQCNAGNTDDSSFPSQGSDVKWNCSGSDGGSDASCRASRGQQQTVIDNPPTISITSKPSSNTVDSNFNITVKGKDDNGIDVMSYKIYPKNQINDNYTKAYERDTFVNTSSKSYTWTLDTSNLTDGDYTALFFISDGKNEVIDIKYDFTFKEKTTDNPPTISITSKPSSNTVDSNFNITVKGKDDNGIDVMSYKIYPKNQINDNYTKAYERDTFVNTSSKSYTWTLDTSNLTDGDYTALFFISDGKNEVIDIKYDFTFYKYKKEDKLTKKKIVLEEQKEIKSIFLSSKINECKTTKYPILSDELKLNDPYSLNKYCRYGNIKRSSTHGLYKNIIVDYDIDNSSHWSYDTSGCINYPAYVHGSYKYQGLESKVEGGIAKNYADKEKLKKYILAKINSALINKPLTCNKNDLIENLKDEFFWKEKLTEHINNDKIKYTDILNLAINIRNSRIKGQSKALEEYFVNHYELAKLLYETDKKKFFSDTLAFVGSLNNKDLLVKVANITDSTIDFNKEVIESIPDIIPAMLAFEWTGIDFAYFEAYIETNLRIAVAETFIPVSKVRWIKGIDKPLFLKKIILLSKFYKVGVKLKYSIFNKLSKYEFDLLEDHLKNLRVTKDTKDKREDVVNLMQDIIDGKDVNKAIIRNKKSYRLGINFENLQLKALGVNYEKGFSDRATLNSPLRKIDLFDLKNGKAIECKVGELTNFDFISEQLKKDRDLLLSGKKVKEVKWHLTVSPVTGKGGTKDISKRLQRLIDDINNELKSNNRKEIEFIDIEMNPNDLDF